LSLVPVAAKPPLAVAIASLKSPSQILDLDHLPEQCGCRILATVSKQIRTRGNELARNAKQHRHGDGFITAMPERGDAIGSIGANDMTKHMEFGACGEEVLGAELSQFVTAPD
jgi:hypothetical protein